MTFDEFIELTAKWCEYRKNDFESASLLSEYAAQWVCLDLTAYIRRIKKVHFFDIAIYEQLFKSGVREKTGLVLNIEKELERVAIGVSCFYQELDNDEQGLTHCISPPLRGSQAALVYFYRIKSYKDVKPTFPDYTEIYYDGTFGCIVKKLS